MRKIGALHISALALVVGLMFAALPQTTPAQDDPPGRVGRLNFIQGSVSYQVSGDQDWVQADSNRPLTTGDNLWADKDSRAEVHIGSTAIRMSSETGISFLTLDDRTVQLQLAQGTTEVHLRNHPSGDAFEIDTPNLAFTITRPGEYRIQTDPNGSSTVIVVREGEGEVTGGGESWDLRAGQQYTFSGTDQIAYDATAAPDFDDFENWCQERDQRENSAISARYVSRDVDGYYDLDDYGDWSTDNDYGEIWVPRGVAVGWAPYQVGHWVFIAPWGWTWIDDEPWGFAPFHYGRWAFVGNRWGWVPGPLVVRPVYAPALVGFVGGGGFGFSVSFGGGFSGVAWFPLGPSDVFVPGYRCSPRYVQNINITNSRVINVSQVTNVYNNVYVNHNTAVTNNYTYGRNVTAITAVSRDTFVNARPVASSLVRVTPEQIQSARVVGSQAIAPTRTSYISANARPATAKPVVPFAQRPVVARLSPAVSRPAPIYTNDTRAFNREQSTPPDNQRGASNNSPQQNDEQPRNSQQPSSNGFRPFQPPNASNSQPPNQANSDNQQRQYQQHPAMQYTPPQKAREENYDVHPPLNQRQTQTQTPPKQETPHPQPQPHQQEQKEEKH
jgi:hypothetical protein